MKSVLLTSLAPALASAAVVSSNFLAPNTFVKAVGPAFLLEDKPFYYGGSNCYYLFYAQQSDVDSLFQAANNISATAIRTWLWSDGGGALSAGWNNTNLSLQGQVWFQERNVTSGEVVYNDEVGTGLANFDCKSCRQRIL